MKKVDWFIGFVLLVWMIISILYFSYSRKKVEPTTNLQQSQYNLDSIKAIHSKQLDSVNTINVELNSKIEAKNEVIRTLKVLVNDNNTKYKVITDSALVVELERLRGVGIR